ncbi:MAG: hypothetical protein HPY83_05925 [Anaerolineae bacterium]|nr:hypothetical protein [Anaerolineae bacterium]
MARRRGTVSVTRGRLRFTSKGFRYQAPRIRVGGRLGVNVSKSGISASYRGRGWSYSTRRGCSLRGCSLLLLPVAIALATVAIALAACAPSPTASPATTATPALMTSAPQPLPTNTPIPDALAGMTAAQVIEVLDGDTIRVLIAGAPETVRYIGIDAPEGTDPGSEGGAAADANAELVGSQVVYLESDTSNRDVHGRLLRYVWLGTGVMVNEELCRLGYASAVSYPPDVKHQERLEAAAHEAREARRGLWALPAATAAAQPAAGAASVVISEYAGGGKPEYVAITNTGAEPVDLTGWRLESVVRGDEEQTYRFPRGYVLPAGATVKVYSGEGATPDPPDGLFWTDRNMWNNKGDDAELYDAAGRLVDSTR